MEDSILLSIKKLIGGYEDDDSFDTDLIIHINSAFSVLSQLGVGPKDGFSIGDDEDTWSDFLPGDPNKLRMVKTYIYLKVKLWFDPPSASVLSSIKEQINELEWRLNVAVDPEDKNG